MVSPTVHTNRQENGAFPNALQTTVRFGVDGKHVENGAFRIR